MLGWIEFELMSVLLNDDKQLVDGCVKALQGVCEHYKQTGKQRKATSGVTSRQMLSAIFAEHLPHQKRSSP